MTSHLSQRLHAAHSRIAQRLVSELGPDGHWTGELSSSALSTATAVTALATVDRAAHDSFIQAGLQWLVDHANPDGGWGDTIRSRSNPSTTALAWAAFGAAGADSSHPGTVAKAARHLEQSLGPLDRLVPSIEALYGKDRTFSVPITMTLALSGRLGPQGWKQVRPLPFELAALPQTVFGALQLPVVSYALPALIAIGQVIHHRSQRFHPIRALTRHRTLRVLTSLQPENGGFLEATPLTSFVTMSLAGMGLSQHVVAQRGADFLRRSRRPDGSWPIDTNLATWVTTLSIKALSKNLSSPLHLNLNPNLDHPSAPPGSNSVSTVPAPPPLSKNRPSVAAGVSPPGIPASRSVGPAPAAKAEPLAPRNPAGCMTRQPVGFEQAALDAPRRLALRQWLLGQQYRVKHPYTGAAPGGWAWTDLPGGVPDADDTAGALLALRLLGEPDRETHLAAVAGVEWLLGLQNRDGGIPTFCRGWGTLPFDRSTPELTAHALRAWDAWEPSLPSPLRDRVTQATRRALDYLGRSQRDDGAWIPLWFGNEQAQGQENPVYGTAQILIALHERKTAGLPIHEESRQRAGQFLVRAQRPDGAWGGDAHTEASLEETALALEALLGFPEFRPQAEAGLIALLNRLEASPDSVAAPIGLYFARLWYFERLYPLIFTVSALGQAIRTETESEQR